MCGGGGGYGGFAGEAFVLLFFLCFCRHAFSLYTLSFFFFFTVSNVARFLFEHLFTYCAIDSDLKKRGPFHLAPFITQPI